MNELYKLITLVALGATVPYSYADQPASPFAPCTAEIVQRLYQTLADVHDYCALMDVPYFIDSGTLLGAVRHNGLIPWDDDLDLCIFEEHEQKFVQFFPLLQALGYDIIAQIYGYKIYKADGLAVDNYPWKHPACDIFIMLTDGQKAFYKMYWRKEKPHPFELNLSDIFPLRTYVFGPLPVYGPRNPFPYLSAWYGEDYMTMAYRDYDHSTDRSTEKAAKILKESDCKPARPTSPLVRHIKRVAVPEYPRDFAKKSQNA